jgi:hypothetical protein
VDAEAAVMRGKFACHNKGTYLELFYVVVAVYGKLDSSRVSHERIV